MKALTCVFMAAITSGLSHKAVPNENAKRLPTPKAHGQILTLDFFLDSLASARRGVATASTVEKAGAFLTAALVSRLKN